MKGLRLIIHMNFVRKKLSGYQKIKDNEGISGNSTSVRGKYMNPSTGKTGFYKMNECFWGEPDLRELLSSIILKSINVPCADIELVYDDIEKKANGCLSMNILKPGEHFVEQDNNKDNHQISGKGIDAYIERDIYNYKKTLPNIPPEFWNERKDFLINYVFLSAFLGNYDIKTDNCQIIFNSNDGTIRNPEYYDMGMSFSDLSLGRSFYEGKNAEDVMEEIYHKYPEQVKEISLSISTCLIKDYVESILQDKIFETLSQEEYNIIWKKLGDMIVLVNQKNEEFYCKKFQNGFTISHEDLAKLSKETPNSIKEIASKFFKNIIGRTGR